MSNFHAFKFVFKLDCLKETVDLTLTICPVAFMYDVFGTSDVFLVSLTGKYKVFSFV